MRKQNGSIDQEKVDTSNETEEPEEPDECALGNGNSLEIFLRRALNATNGKLYIYKVCGGRSMRGKSLEDFVQDGFVECLASGKIICINHSENSPPLLKAGMRANSSGSVAGQAKLENVSATSVKTWESITNDISTLKEIIEHVSNALKKASNSKEVRLIKNSFTGHLEDPTPPQQRQMADNELNKKLAMVFDKFYIRLPSNKKRAINAIVNADIPEMLKLFTSKYNEILEHLVKFGYLNEDYTRMKMSFTLHRPVQLRENLPEEFSALSKNIFHVLKGDKIAKKRYLARKLKISYKKARVLYNSLQKELRNSFEKEFKNGILSALSEFDKMEILKKLT